LSPKTHAARAPKKERSNKGGGGISVRGTEMRESRPLYGGSKSIRVAERDTETDAERLITRGLQRKKS